MRSPLSILLLCSSSAHAFSGRAYDLQRAGAVFGELVSRAGLRVPDLGGGSAADALKQQILGELSAYGDPAMGVPAATRQRVDELARSLERSNPTAQPATDGIGALDGRWRVRYSDAPPPSNGALGPLVGEAYQIVDVASSTYINELSLFGGGVRLSLAADFKPSDDDSLRVAFRTIALSVGALTLPPFKFPAGTERTWVLTYTDADTRIVRAGVDGGRSTARELGLIDAGEGEARDAYIFVMSRAQAAPRASRAELKRQLLAACEAQRLGAASSTDDDERIIELMRELSELNPTADPASSPSLAATWDVVWTTESELLFLTDSGLFGLPCTGTYQTITRNADGTSSLANEIEFEAEDGGVGRLSVGSTCERAAAGGRVDFRFESCGLRWRQLKLPLPPVGTGWFEVTYLDDELRLARDSRGDYQVCRRRR